MTFQAGESEEPSELLKIALDTIEEQERVKEERQIRKENKEEQLNTTSLSPLRKVSLVNATWGQLFV
jgi:hypothetical protein